MDQLEYQRTLAEFDEKINFHKAEAAIADHGRSKFVRDVMDATLKAKTNKENFEKPPETIKE